MWTEIKTPMRTTEDDLRERDERRARGEEEEES